MTRATTPASIRARAARIVSEVSAHGKSLDALFAQPACTAQDTPQERGLLRSLVYGTIRWQIRLEAALDRLSARPQKDLDPEVRALLLVGLFQLLHTDIASHAAVAETVEGVRVLKYPRAAGLVNAVLRRCQRETKRLVAILDSDIATRTAHPTWFVEKLRQDWPGRYLEILEANNAHPPFWLRVNTQRVATDEYLERLRASGHSASHNQYAPEALLLDAAVDVRLLPGFEQGDVSIQDAAAQLAPHLLVCRPGDRVLDACAAPGGKTCHLLEMQPRIGYLLAVDVAADRLRKVRENLDRLHLDADLKVGDAAKPASWWDGRPFERILLDVPCSATGVIRRHPDIKLLRRHDDIDELARRQAALLRGTWSLLAPGGRLLYASCSTLRAETTEVVARFLDEHADARDVTPEICKALGMPSNSGPGLTIHAGEAQMDGFYYACLARN